MELLEAVWGFTAARYLLFLQGGACLLMVGWIVWCHLPGGVLRSELRDDELDYLLRDPADEWADDLELMPWPHEAIA